jgi:hypothetical protein
VPPLCLAEFSNCFARRCAQALAGVAVAGSVHLSSRPLAAPVPQSVCKQLHGQLTQQGLRLQVNEAIKKAEAEAKRRADKQIEMKRLHGKIAAMRSEARRRR